MTSTDAGISRTLRPSLDALSAGASVLSGVLRVASTRTSGKVVCANVGAARAPSAAATDIEMLRLAALNVPLLILIPSVLGGVMRPTTLVFLARSRSRFGRSLPLG
jgi:hypothetical protein